MSQITDRNPFHEGELEVQNLTGEQTIASRLSRLIQGSIPTGALDFVRQQRVIWVGIEGLDGFPRAFPLFGLPGFINPDKERQIEISLTASHSIPAEWHSSLLKGKFIACLAIDLSTRSRLRINGVIRGISKTYLTIDIQQAYPNCPKYIRKREMRGKSICSEFAFITNGTELNEQTTNIVSCSDTAFVASMASNGADVSHRGGPSGFIKCNGTNRLLVPDYKGNSMFNTLGNFKANPHGGMTIVNFRRGYYLQLSGQISITLDSEPSVINTGGTNRFWELEVRKWYLFELEGSLKWESLDFSPYNP